MGQESREGVADTRCLGLSWENSKVDSDFDNWGLKSSGSVFTHMSEC